MEDDYVSSYDYPEGYIQGGTRGLVIVRGGQNYRTAFIEFFPATGGFIRGEGKTVEEAEKEVLEKITKETSCSDHEYTPKHYTNGVGFCKHCGQMKSHAFTAEELEQFCVTCGVPTGVESGRQTKLGVFVCDEHDGLARYNDMLFYINWEYDGNEDINTETMQQFEENRIALKEICFEQRDRDEKILEYFAGVKSREAVSIKD